MVGLVKVAPLTYTLRYYCLSILDKHHHPDIDFEQGMKILRMCTDELKRRLPIDFKGVSLVLPRSWERLELILDAFRCW